MILSIAPPDAPPFEHLAPHLARLGVALSLAAAALGAVACGPGDGGQAPANEAPAEGAAGEVSAGDGADAESESAGANGAGATEAQRRATALALGRGTATAGAPATEEAFAADNRAYNEAVRAEIEETVGMLFASAIGETDPAWHDVTVRRMSTRDLAQLQRQPPPPPGAYRAEAGSVWVVGFRTDHAVTPETMSVANVFELQQVGPEDWADEEGRTTVYFVLTITERGTRLQYTPLARGILPAKDPLWTLQELAAVESQ